MAKKLKETYRQTYRQTDIQTDRHTDRHTDRLPLVVLSAAVAAKNIRIKFYLPIKFSAFIR